MNKYKEMYERIRTNINEHEHIARKINKYEQIQTNNNNMTNMNKYQ